MENPSDDVGAFGRSYTIAEFCQLEHIDQQTYRKLRRLGLGPVETRPPGTALVRISPDARRDWHARMHERQQTQQAKLERERRRQQAIEAGKRSAASPKHISKRNRAALSDGGGAP